jgi:hypothetical protein
MDGSNNCFIGVNSGTDPYNRTFSVNDCTLLGQNTQVEPGSDHMTIIGSDATGDVVFSTMTPPLANAIILGRQNTDNTYVMNDLYLKRDLILIDGELISNAQLTWLSTINLTLPTTITNKLVANTFDSQTINGTTGVDLTIGNSSSTTKINGPLVVSNNAQKVNGYSILSGSPNNLTKPLGEYYTLSTAATGAVTLPIIDSDMYGSQVTFTKSSATNTWTVNAGSGNTFRLFKSDSTATATSISMANDFTVLRIVATQSTVWDVLQGDPNIWAYPERIIAGTNFYAFDCSGANTGISALDLSNNTSSPIYKTYTVNITANTTFNLPRITDPRVFEGMEIIFRRIGGTTTATLTLQRGGPSDLIAAPNAVMGTATTATLLASSQYVGRVQCILKVTSGIGYWMCY